MTLMERDYKNRQEGIAEGRTEGRTEGRVSILWEDGKTVEEIAARLDMSENEVEEIIDSLDE